MTLREIRLFHWRQLMATRQLQEHANSEKRAKLERIAMDHLGAVQCLNDYCEGTAEQDDANGIPTHSVLSRNTIRADAISSAHNLAELCSRYAAHLERGIPAVGETFTAGPEAIKALQERQKRAELVRELGAIFFRAAELERSK